LGNGARQIYSSGGLRALLYRLSGYLWKEICWLWILTWDHSHFIKRTVYGNIIYLSRQDTGISKTLAVYKIHEPISTKILRNQIKSGMCVIDIGANIGYYTLQQAQLVGETGRVIAIEPVPDNVTLLKKNVAANGYSNVIIHEVAIGAENGTAKIYMSSESNLASLFFQKRLNKSVDVPLWTLDTFLEGEDRVDYIQMDVEGYEVEVIKGMLGILKKHKPALFVEIHPTLAGGDAIIRFLCELKDLGYKTKCLVDKAFNYSLIKKKGAIEILTIDELMIDRRIAKGQAVLSVFFEAS
jgi:FkbM family methyltransferase